MRIMTNRATVAAFSAVALAAACGGPAAGGADGERPLELLNVSYDPTRELYQELNANSH
jgi:sulfate transport system substrate-binding protein